MRPPDEELKLTKRGRRLMARELMIAALATIAGVGIAWVDTGPKWDDTGVTAGALLLVAGLAAVFGLRWWAATLLVALPILLVELPRAGWGVAISLALTAAGALIGATLRRIVRDGAAGASSGREGHDR